MINQILKNIPLPFRRVNVNFNDTKGERGKVILSSD